MAPKYRDFWILFEVFYQFINAEESVTLQPHSMFHISHSITVVFKYFFILEISGSLR